MNINYSKLLEEKLLDLKDKGIVPKLLLHSCCAPCSSYVIEYLSNYFYITVLYYNPNIFPFSEYSARKNEQIRLINTMKTKYRVSFVDCDYDNDKYEDLVKGYENEPEKGSRCSLCFELRLDKTGKTAKEEGYDYFATTLTLSPYKNSKIINEIGFKIQDKYNVNYLASDFKKKDGYKRSIELSHEYNLYRQNYCGCKYSRVDRD